MTVKDEGLRDRLRALADFLPILERPDFTCGELICEKLDEPGGHVMPYYILSDEASAFFDMVCKKEWVIMGFNWGAWMGTPVALRLRDDPEMLAAATPEQLAKLLTILVRQERFCEGSFASAYDSGLLLGIVRRAAALLKEIEGRPLG